MVQDDSAPVLNGTGRFSTSRPTVKFEPCLEKWGFGKKYANRRPVPSAVLKSVQLDTDLKKAFFKTFTSNWIGDNLEKKMLTGARFHRQC